jgi:hypothetical protein
VLLSARRVAPDKFSPDLLTSVRALQEQFRCDRPGLELFEQPEYAVGGPHRPQGREPFGTDDRSISRSGAIVSS